jgi:trk system potassium uptake protein TrkH
MNRFHRTDAGYLLLFFLVLILAGTLLLSLPEARTGGSALGVLDAAFTAAAAVCVSGLAVADTATFSRFGLVVLMLLIQAGGLGIISFSSILLTIPGNRLGISKRAAIQGFYTDGVEYRPKRIVRNIIFFTAAIELAGTAVLSLAFRAEGVPDWLFMGLFHGVSAFCNAGVSPLSHRLPAMLGDSLSLSAAIAVLALLGGLGFIVLQDVLEVCLARKRRLSYHSRVVLALSGILVGAGAALFFVFERTGTLAGRGLPGALSASFFQAVMPRSAGFELLPQAALTLPSKFLTGLLMLVGGAPGSIAGGIKVTTVFAVAVLMLMSPDRRGDVRVFHHRLTAATLYRAVVYTLKALALLLACVGALALFEGRRGAGEIVFEALSAFGTVGLSLGITPFLSAGGKLVIIAAMFAGRVGLAALAFPSAGRNDYTYPEGTVLLG